VSHGARKEPSDEADERQLELAMEEGEACQRSVRYMTEQVAVAGGTKTVGEFEGVDIETGRE